MLINGVGLLGFRDPHGIRPLVFGQRPCTTKPGATDFMMASESVAIDTLRFALTRDVGAGEAILITLDGAVHAAICAEAPTLNPCIFEYVYFARPDSIMDGVQVYEARLNMGEMLARKILRLYPNHDIDVVIPVPDTSRTSGLSCAYTLGRCVV
jgi:amidophosphoribosyltransferase